MESDQAKVSERGGWDKRARHGEEEEELAGARGRGGRNTDDLGSKFTPDLLCTFMLQIKVYWHSEMHQEGIDKNLPTLLRPFSWGRFSWHF